MAYLKNLDYHFSDDFCNCHQITIPLLYDDCMTLLQKVNALRAILADFIKSYNDMLGDLDKYLTEIYKRLEDVDNQIDSINLQIAEIKTEVSTLRTKINGLETEINNLHNDIKNLRSDLTAVTNRVTKIEGDLTAVTNRVTKIEGDLTAVTNRVTKIEGDLTALTQRVRALEDAFANLHIVIPVEMFKENDIAWFMKNVSTPILDRVKSAGGDAGWEVVGNLFAGDGQPAVTFEAGRLGFNIVRSIMPLIFRHSLGASVSDDTVKTLCTNFVRGFLKGMTGSFIPITLYHDTPYAAAAEIEYESGGLLLLGASPEATVVSEPKILIRTDSTMWQDGDSDGVTYAFAPSSSVRTVVRWQIPAPGSRAAGLLISAEHSSPVFYIVTEGNNNYLYATLFAEHN